MLVSVFAMIAFLAAGAAGLGLFVGLEAANGAPQEAAVAAMACAVAIIPYVLARSVEIMDGVARRRREAKEELDALVAQKAAVDARLSTEGA